MVNVNLEIFSNFMFEYEVIGEAECVLACVRVYYLCARTLAYTTGNTSHIHNIVDGINFLRDSWKNE